MKKLVLASAIMAAAVLSGCASSGSGGVQYANPTAVDNTNLSFGSTDLQMLAKSMVQQLLASPTVANLPKDKGQAPILFVDQIHNQTQEVINMDNINNTISTQLLNSGHFRFVDMSAVAAIRKQMRYQHESGMVDQATSAKIGKQVGAHYMLYGALSSINKQNSKVKDVYYLFTLKLTDIQSGLVVWQGQKQIRKVQSKSTFGW